jgi:pimeloyl-ACP methyl ester carboxylesterase
MHIEVDGLRLFADVLSPEYVPAGPTMVRRPTVVCLHGSMDGDHTNVRALAEHLTDVACVVVTDRRGNGRSDGGGPATWNLDRYADDVYELCKAMGIIKPIVLGTSYGGYIAQRYAGRHPTHPSGLALLATAARWDLDALAKYRDKLEEPYRPDVTEALRNRTARAIRRRPVTDYPESVYLMDVDLREQNKAITCPTIVISGVDDPIDRSNRAEELAASIGADDVSVHRIPSAAHLLDIEAPEETARLLREFIQRVGAPEDPWGPGRTPYQAAKAGPATPEKAE